MPGAIIAFDQVRGMSTSFGTPGVARNDLWEENEVLCRSTTSGNTAYSWVFLDIPPGSAAVLENADLQNANFTPDLPGSYRVQLTTNSGGPGNVQVLVAAVRYNSTGTLVNRGWRNPAFGELAAEDNFSGQTRGWAEAFEYIFADLLAVIEGGLAGGVVVQNAGTPLGTFTTLDFDGAGVTATSLGGGVAKVEIPGGGGGGSYTVYTHDCSAGGTITYAGPTPVSNQIQLTGSPGAAFTFVLPSGTAFDTLVQNGTGQPVTTKVSGLGDGPVVSQFGNMAELVYTGSELISLPEAYTNDTDIYWPTANQPFVSQISGNGGNVFSPGYIPVGALLSIRDASSAGWTPPFLGTGTQPLVQGNAVTPVWGANYPGGQASLYYGLFGCSPGGYAQNLVPEVYYQNNPHNTQHLALLGAAFSDTAVGPGATCTFILDDIPPGSVTTATIKVLARVVSSSGPESPGDSFTTTFEVAWTEAGSNLTVLPPVATLTGVLSAFATTGNMQGCAAGAATGGATLVITYTNGSVGGDTEVDVQCHIIDAAVL